MSSSVEALQSCSRQRNRLRCDSETKSCRRDEPIINTVSEAAKCLAVTVSNAINKFWPNNNNNNNNNNDSPPSQSNPVHRDVTINVDQMIVYDRPIENDFVEVAFASQVQTRRKRQPSIDEEIMGSKPPSSLPIAIPKSSHRQAERRDRKERHFI